MIYLNNKKVNFGQFPNNEINLPLSNLKIKKHNIVKFIYEDDGDIFKLSLIKSCLDDLSVRSLLEICYMPYSRMDRANGIYAVSLKCMTKLINDMKFGSVQVREPHSRATIYGINNMFVDWWCESRLLSVAELFNADTLFFPDKGAQDRYKVDSLPSAIGFKKRNFQSGDIEEYNIDGNVGQNVLIVDDLCSRGGTFIKASILLKEKGAKHIALLVAHCENNVFTGSIFDHIDMLYTSKELLNRDHSKIIKLN